MRRLAAKYDWLLFALMIGTIGSLIFGFIGGLVSYFLAWHLAYRCQDETSCISKLLSRK